MATGAPNPGDLARLLDMERRLEMRLRAARADRDGLVAAARAAADAGERALEEGIALDQRRLAATLTAQREAAEREIAESAVREVAALEGIPDRRLIAVAQELARQFLLETGRAL